MEAMLTTPARGFHEAANCRPCPNCKKVMAPVDSIHENGILFIWYECKDATCGGQWLEKRVLCGKGA